jgi:hypothetical protein
MYEHVFTRRMTLVSVEATTSFSVYTNITALRTLFFSDFYISLLTYCSLILFSFNLFVTDAQKSHIGGIDSVLKITYIYCYTQSSGTMSTSQVITHTIPFPINNYFSFIHSSTTGNNIISFT